MQMNGQIIRSLVFQPYNVLAFRFRTEGARVLMSSLFSPMVSAI